MTKFLKPCKTLCTFEPFLTLQPLPMAGTKSKTDESMMRKKKEKKRKLSNSQVTEKPAKSTRKINDNEEEEICAVEATEKLQNIEVDEETPMKNTGAYQWRNLELILSIQNKQLNARKKVELIFEFANSKMRKADNGTEDFNTISISRLVSYISNWIQTLLITSEKKIRAGNMESEDSQLILDIRCWEILRICLRESERLHNSLSLSRDLLRVVSCVAKSALYSFNFGVIDTKEFTFTSGKFEFFSTVKDCLKLLFSSNGRLLNENLDSWAVAVNSVLELIISLYTDNHQDSGLGNLVIEFSCLVLEPFSKFVRVHPCRKNGFRDFVDKLLEPLLHVLGLLHDQSRDESPLLLQNLFKLIEEILSYGLFHSVHLDEYLNLRITDKYNSSAVQIEENARTFIKSYHRHLFDKVDNFISERKMHSLSGIGDMFRLFIVNVKKLKRDTKDATSLGALDTPNAKHLSKISNLTSEKSNATMIPASELRKSFFDFFVLTMEPLLLDLSKHLQSDPQPETSILDVYYTLKSVNKILCSLLSERAYLRIEDSSGGACLNFFKKSYGLLMLCYAKFNRLCLSTWGSDSSIQVEILKSLAKEFIFMVGYFLEIEYVVIGDDLVGIWLMILTFLALSHSSEDVSKLCPLFSRTVELGCRIIRLYSELRQVDLAVFALCKGLRHLSFFQGDGEMEYLEMSSFNPSLYYDKFATSGCLLLSSQKFRLAICNVVRSIPEGQAVDIVQTLSVDISSCLDWMKDEHSVTSGPELGDAPSCRLSTQAKVLGTVFSEIYTLVLDSLPVSAGYSYHMGKSLEELMMVLRPSMRHLTALEQNGADEFIFSVLERTQNRNMESKNTFWDKIPFLLLFFFRIYVSCRSLYRQSLSLMPPDSSSKMGKVMDDSYTSYSGEDCMKRTKFKDKGYFAWLKSSAPLLSTLQFIKDNVCQEGSEDCCCLIYVMHMMALQRLVDLSRQIHCVEYILCRSENERSGTSMDDANVSIPHKGDIKQKKSKKQEKLKEFLSALKEETFGLTGFIMEFLSNMDEQQQPTSISRGRGTNSSSPEYTFVDSWDLGICTINENTLPTAIWWIICQNIDIWCNYASKKNLKLFLSVLILNALPYGRLRELEKQPESSSGDATKVTKHQISQQLLHDTSFYNQRFVRRYMVSRVCYTLKKCISQLFYSSKNIGAELGSSDWTKGLSVLQNKAISVGYEPVKIDCTHSDVVDEHCDKGTSSTTTNVHLAACRSLLNLLCMMMDVSLSFKSFSRLVIYLINFERLIIGCLLDSFGSLCLLEHCECLGLLVSCRRALKYILMEFNVDKSELCISTKVPVFAEVLPSIMWLLESMKLVITRWNTLSSQDTSTQFNDMITSLVDQTSYVFFTLCKHQFGLAICSIVSPGKTNTSVFDSDGNHSNEHDCTVKMSNDVEDYKSVLVIVEVLEEETKNYLLSLKDAFTSGDGEIDVQPADLKKLSSAVSCIQGFLWGLECALNDIFSNGNELKVKLMKSKHSILSRVNGFMNHFLELIGLSSRLFLHNHPVKQGKLNLDPDNNILGTDASLKESINYGSEFAVENRNGNSGSQMMSLATCGLQHGSDSGRRKKKLQLDNLHSAVDGLAEFGSFNYNCLRVSLLGSFFDGQNQDAAFLLRGLFVASSAIVRLSMLIDCSPLSSNLIQNFLGCSEVLLIKFSQMLAFPNQSSFVWLDGAVIFLEAMGIVFASTSFIATKSVYTKLVELHFKAIGKCISLQGKDAILASHIESSKKIYVEGVSESTSSNPLYGLDSLKSRLRMSFKALVEKSSESFLSSALQVLERALVGLREGFSMIYEIKRESIAGGTVSSTVAGAVDCLDMLLEFYKGKNQLNVVKTHINGIFASLFSIMVHLQGSTVFCIPNRSAVNQIPDSGSVVLMCVEILTRISGKRAQYYLDSRQVGQSLHKPATLFKDFCYIRAAKGSHQSVIRLHDKEYEELEIDRQFSVNLYAASCRLLWTVVKHRKSECVRCIALLQNSLQVLLRCLEVVDADSEARQAYFAWDVEEGVKCATYLRRVYEEIGQQKDVLGQHCFMFLSDYIWLYSGYGPLRRGIKKEIDEALRPGFYALLDVCSADDLQYLHTVFGEGSCRSTLARLKDDHKRQQYEGKV
ncbi:Unhealthy ribosome biogenesis protein 2-like protein [Bienertia sinuspersici]